MTRLSSRNIQNKTARVLLAQIYRFIRIVFQVLNIDLKNICIFVYER